MVRSPICGRSHLTNTGETGPGVDLDHPSIGFMHVKPRRSARTTVGCKLVGACGRANGQIVVGAVALIAVAAVVAIIVGIKMSH